MAENFQEPRRRVHKRFTAFLITTGSLLTGFLFGPEAAFAAFAGAIGLTYAAFVGGQSATDFKKTATQ